MLYEGLPEPLTRPSSSFVPSSAYLVVILPPSGKLTPSPSTFGGVYRRWSATRARRRVFGRFGQNGQIGLYN